VTVTVELAEPAADAVVVDFWPRPPKPAAPPLVVVRRPLPPPPLGGNSEQNEPKAEMAVQNKLEENVTGLEGGE
jgi:hypothetical protein